MMTEREKMRALFPTRAAHQKYLTEVLSWMAKRGMGLQAIVIKTGIPKKKVRALLGK